MRVSRRRFVWVSVVLGCSTLVGRLRGQGPSPGEVTLGLQAWVETLLPSDAGSPGAGRLNVHLQIIEKAKQHRQYRQLLELGVRWADTEAQKAGALNFAALPAEQAVSIVARAETMGAKSMQGLFFLHTLRDAKHYYYLNSKSWQGVGFPHAPQPMGFMDYTEAPK